MIEILSRKHCLWWNRFSERPAYAAEIGFGDADGWTSADIPLASARALVQNIPFLPPLSPARGIAEFTAGLALGLQKIVDVIPPFSGVAGKDKERQAATVFFSCRDPFAGKVSIDSAVRLVSALTNLRMTDERFAALLDECLSRTHLFGLDQSMRAILETAERRNIPWLRMMMASRHVQLGQGARQQRLIESLPGTELVIARELSRNKVMTLTLLLDLRLPVGKFAIFKDVEAAMQAAERIGYPLVLKPVRGSKGQRVYANLRSSEELRALLLKEKDSLSNFLLQSFFPGEDHRMLVVDGRLVAVARRMPAAVTGDGKHTIAQLIAEANRDERRGHGFTRLMNFIAADAETARVLAQKGLTLENIPKPDEEVRVRATANIATGGTAVEETNIHPDNVRVAERAAKALGLRVAGIDFISPDISRSWREAGGGICEVNPNVSLQMHAIANPETDVTGPLLETMFAKGDDGRIPTTVIAGSVAAAVVAAMLGGILAAAGHVPGCATASRVSIGPEVIATGDHTGIKGAAIVLRDPDATAAIVEMDLDRLDDGLPFERCDVAAILNAGAKSQAERRLLKAPKCIVLNADDIGTISLVREFSSRTKVVLFSPGRNAAAVRDHAENGGETISAALFEGCAITAGDRTAAMTAAGLARGLGIADEVIVAGLKGYVKAHSA